MNDVPEHKRDWGLIAEAKPEKGRTDGAPVYLYECAECGYRSTALPVLGERGHDGTHEVLATPVEATDERA